nr:basic proline-rich protein-like [Gorilla gorilla gorilla]
MEAQGNKTIQVCTDGQLSYPRPSFPPRAPRPQGLPARPAAARAPQPGCPAPWRPRSCRGSGRRRASPPPPPGGCGPRPRAPRSPPAPRPAPLFNISVLGGVSASRRPSAWRLLGGGRVADGAGDRGAAAAGGGYVCVWGCQVKEGSQAPPPPPPPPRGGRGDPEPRPPPSAAQLQGRLQRQRLRRASWQQHMD